MYDCDLLEIFFLRFFLHTSFVTYKDIFFYIQEESLADFGEIICGATVRDALDDFVMVFEHL